MNQINLNYVATKKISIVEDGAPKEYSVLVLDEDSNAEYWSVVKNLVSYLENEARENPHDPVSHWVLAKGALFRGLGQLIIEQNEDDANYLQLLGLPLEMLESDDAVFDLVLASGKKIEILWE